jgi:hypothetical protein
MRLHGPEALPATHVLPNPQPQPAAARDVPAVAELLVGVFRRDLGAFFPQSVFEPIGPANPLAPNGNGAARFRLIDEGDACLVELFGARYRVGPRDGSPLGPQDRRMIEAIGAVLELRHHHLFRPSGAARLDLYRGGSEDHYVAAFVEPWTYRPPGARPSRIAAALHALRTAALSTYENHRVSTGVLLLGPRDDPHHRLGPTPPDALPYGVELTGLKSVHRLCDGERTLFLVDRDGRLTDILDVAHFAAELPPGGGPEIPCARTYAPHARATRSGGHVCVVLSPNGEIKLFAEGVQTFAFAHGRWRILDVAAKFSVWESAVADAALARSLFAAATNLAEARKGALFVVVAEPAAAVGRLIAEHDLLGPPPGAPPSELSLHDPLARRALHYLARGRSAEGLDPPVLEALASLDGALATDRDGRLLAFGAILRHDAAELPGLTAAEGARTTAALVASQFGPVLKVSEDGIISCFLHGRRVWDL